MIDLEKLVVRVGQHDASPSDIARAEALEEAAIFLESAKQFRGPDFLYQCFGREDFGDGWEGLSLTEKHLLRSCAGILRKMAAKYRRSKYDQAA